MAIHSSILAWKIPWTEEFGGVQSMGWQRVGHEWLSTHTITDTYIAVVDSPGPSAIPCHPLHALILETFFPTCPKTRGMGYYQLSLNHKSQHTFTCFPISKLMLSCLLSHLTSFFFLKISFLKIIKVSRKEIRWPISHTLFSLTQLSFDMLQFITP